MSATNFEPLKGDKLTFSSRIPRQLPYGFDQSNIENTAKIIRVISILGMVAIIASISYSLFFKPMFFNLWSFYFTLQLISYLGIYNMPMPGNAEIFIDLFKQAIDLRFLWIDTYI